MEPERPILGIICGGGPCPGLNDAIGAATLYAYTLGWRVIGLHSGYKHLATGNIDIVKKNIIELTPEVVSPYFCQAGSIILTDRFDPSTKPYYLANVYDMLLRLHVRYLIMIGGNDKIVCTYKLTQGVDPFELQVVAIPKTIDNDIPLPPDQSCFGFHSARSFASKLVNNLIQDARSAPRWFVVELMGKQTGHLALSVADAAGAHVCIIPEDFGDHKVELRDICDVFEAAVYKRLSAGKNYGVCCISEGLINKMTKESIESLRNRGFITYDSDNKIILDDAELSRAVVNEMKQRVRKRDVQVRFSPKKIGYELRGSPPCSHDAKYGHDLGYAAVEGLRTNHSNCIVLTENFKISYIPFNAFISPNSAKITPRRVSTEKSEYFVAQEYFWHLRVEDLLDSNRLALISQSAKMTPEEFLIEFGHVPALTVV